MIEATRMCITRRAAMMAVLAFLTAQSWLGVVPAHGASARPADVVAERELGRGGKAEGRVMEMARDGDGSALVRLADGTRLRVSADAVRGADPVRLGVVIQAQYRESDDGEKVVIHLRVMPELQAP